MHVLHNLHSVDIEAGALGTTVRNGSKWHDRVVKKNDIGLILCQCTAPCLYPFTCGYQDSASCENCTIVGNGKVQDVWSDRFLDIPARLVELEHEESSRLYSGLMKSMKKAYGDEFNSSNEVTVLSYLRLS